MTTQIDKAKAFRNLHTQDQIFIMPNAWDAGSACFLSAAGFSAIGTTSGGVNWCKGRQDYIYEVSCDSMIAEYGFIANAVNIPVSGDLENGYGDSPQAVAETITKSIAAGMVGGSIEDSTGDEKHPLYEINKAVERIRAARKAADDSSIPYTLTARSEAYYAALANPFAEAVKRVNLFAEAGADCVFVPGLADIETIERFVREIDVPLSVVMGLVDNTGFPLTAQALGAVGVRRISTGGSLTRAVFKLVKDAASEMRHEGTFGYTGNTLSDPEINAFFRARD